MCQNYYVDESGSGIIFNKHGDVILGKEGCSSYFILGMLLIDNKDSLETEFRQLREDLLSDPYFEAIPSMQLSRGKTAKLFHAKDDIPEVRREVFRILQNQELKFFAVIKNMWNVLTYVRNRNQRDPGYRYSPNELYDFTVRNLFSGRLHQKSANNIYFASRGSSDRSRAIKNSLLHTRDRYNRKSGISKISEIAIHQQPSSKNAGLQAVDYFLWALQRCYERNEDRYIKYLWDKVSLIKDLDDTSIHPYGTYYTRRNPLDCLKIKIR